MSAIGTLVIIGASTISTSNGQFSGSLTKLADGTSYLVGAGSTTVNSSSNGQVVITGQYVPQVNVQTFLTSTSWTTSFTGPLFVEGCGGGGGGGGGAGDNTTNFSGGGGGGSLKQTGIVQVTSGSTYSITIGVGGLGGAGVTGVTAATGSSGGATSFDVLFSTMGAGGGDAATSDLYANGGANHTAPLTHVEADLLGEPGFGGYGGADGEGHGQPSFWGFSGGAGGSYASPCRGGGGGGAGPYGTGGVGGTSNGTTGTNGTSPSVNTGAGGGAGSGAKNNNAGGNGAAGGSGKLIISWIA